MHIPARTKYVGPLLWVASLQYLVAQLIVAATWHTYYSLKSNVLSDLGNTACGIYSHRFVCSPLSPVMNISFILHGVLVMGGAFLIMEWFRSNKKAIAGLWCMALAGLGSIAIGLVPENRHSPLHTIAAILPFYVGNFGLIILAMSLHRIPRTLRILAFALGTIGLFAVGLSQHGVNVGLGPGGIERVVEYPESLWTFIFGIYLAKRHHVLYQLEHPHAQLPDVAEE